MKVACEHVVRCGNDECCHNRDGVTCSLKVVALDTTGKCAFIRPKTKVISASAATPSKNSNAC
jgi:hypothetical protein